MHQTAFWSILLSLFCLRQSAGQNASLELSWHYHDKDPQVFTALLHLGGKTEACYILKDAKILDLRLSEGRLKENLAYTYTNNELCLRLPAHADSRSRVFIRYQISQATLEQSPFINLLQPGLVLNALNMEGESGSGSPGLIFPAPADGSAQHLRLNLKINEELNFESPLQNSFTVSGANWVSYFLDSESALNMQDFYLAIGDFRRFDTDELEQEIAAQNEAILAERVDQFEQEFENVLRYVSEKQSRIFTNDELLSLSQLPPPTSFPKFPEIKELPDNKVHKTKSLALLQHYFKDTWTQDWAAYWKGQLSEEEWTQILLNHRNQSDNSRLFWEYRLASYLAKAGKTWSDTNQALERNDSLLLSTAQYFLKRRKPLKVSIQYRLQMQENALKLYTAHGDTNLQLSTPLKGRIHYKDSVANFQIKATLTAADTLSLEIPEAPRSIYLEEDQEGLIIWEEKRPLTYLLYDLSQAPSPKLQRKALLELLETASPKLKTTVVGIALDSDEEELQLLGLSKVNELRQNGLDRLQATIQKMARESDNVKVKQKAQEVLSELEP